MTDHIRVTLEIGPKGKRVVVVAPDWPGLSRGDKSAEAALERLRQYLPRYAPVADLAGMSTEFSPISEISVVDEFPGVGSTDFWGISFAFSEIDHQPMTVAELDRGLSLLQAAWAFLDSTRDRVSVELAKGPRGGGKDRDRVYRHVYYAELDMAKKVGMKPDFESPATEERVHAHRDEFLTSIRAHHSEGKMARKWPLRYLIRHSAYHTLDHAWEMEDKDLTSRNA